METFEGICFIYYWYVCQLLFDYERQKNNEKFERNGEVSSETI